MLKKSLVNVCNVSILGFHKHQWHLLGQVAGLVMRKLVHKLCPKLLSQTEPTSSTVPMLNVITLKPYHLQLGHSEGKHKCIGYFTHKVTSTFSAGQNLLL